jgi:hypothetical protein
MDVMLHCTALCCVISVNVYTCAADLRTLFFAYKTFSLTLSERQGDINSPVSYLGSATSLGRCVSYDPFGPDASG